MGLFDIFKRKPNNFNHLQSSKPKAIVLNKIQFRDGYISPSGGFCNFARFEITGVNPDTGRKNKKIITAKNDYYAKIIAENEFGFKDISINCIAFDNPTEKQLELAQKLNVFIPENANKDDVSCILSRMLDGNKNPEDIDFKPLNSCGQKWADYLCDNNVFFSAYISEENAWNIATSVNFNARERCKIYAYCVWCYLNKEDLNFHIGHPKENLFNLFADTYSNNNEFLNLLNSKSFYNFYSPNGNEKTVKIAKEFFNK